MAHLTSLDGKALLRWAERATHELVARRSEINALNVFPVPDSDTGSNMAHTMEAALTQARDVTGSARDVANALAAGAVRGARGNSGVVLSQVLRGIAHASEEEITGVHVQAALRAAVALVDRAIHDPVEGTVITVLRAAATAAAAAHSTELGEVGRQALTAAQTALANTPSQLEVLREAGVVDAGGQGFLVLLEALVAEVEGSPDVRVELVGEAAKSVYLEVMFHLTCSTPAQLEHVSGRLRSFGDSLMVAREHETAAMIHIHTRQAGPLIEYVFGVGAVRGLHLETLPDAKVDVPERAVIVVAPAGPLSDLYRQAGARVINPGSEVLYDLIAIAHDCGEFILVPNGFMSRRELVSAERAALAAERTIMIVPTAGLMNGIAAVAVHDPQQPIAVDAYAMAEAAREVRTRTLDDPSQLSGAVSEMLAGGGELVTILAAAPVDGDGLRERHPEVEFDFYAADGMDHVIEIGVE
ncbi:DAK2 domain-containing protein [Corynebacterium sp.]|uniref:DAK2 domain-containing protein n=1 Tax=Corynebacterium sp. TaxID=1720 RepID=UPI0026DD3F40|nr:DAK2 domain-containing protein [Corynebacterium sp.]MDO5077969.1 DAK2 domain-containing protein [Corynebacterium sp.]